MKKEIAKILEIKEDIDYKKLSIEDILLLKEYITNLEQCYCNRTDCSVRIKDSKKYDSLQQRIDKAIEYIKNNQCAIHEPTGMMKKMYGKILSEGNCDDLLDILQGSDKEC